MTVLPARQIDALEFCEQHVTIWTSVGTSIGLTAAQINALKGLTDTARENYDAAQAARLASKAATTDQNSAITGMRGKAGELIAQIKAFADLQTNPSSIYALAQIPEPSTPAPLPAPGKPNNFAVTLESDGSVTLSWETANSSASSGAFFTISRKLPGQTGFYGIGGASGSTSESRRCFFTDSSVPASAAGTGAQYIVQGFRGTRSGTPSDAIIVQFGNDGATFTIATDNSAMKLAA